MPKKPSQMPKKGMGKPPMHKMPGGMMMPDKEMKAMMGKSKPKTKKPKK